MVRVRVEFANGWAIQTFFSKSVVENETLLKLALVKRYGQFKECSTI